MGIQERRVGKELPRCTGFSLGLKGSNVNCIGGAGFVNGIKWADYGVWQMHILLMDKFMGKAARRIDLDLSWIDLLATFLPSSTKYGTSPKVLYLHSVICFLLGLLFLSAYLHWWSAGFLILARCDILSSIGVAIVVFFGKGADVDESPSSAKRQGNGSNT